MSVHQDIKLNRPIDVAVERVIVHNEYDRVSISRENDIALLKIHGTNEEFSSSL